MGGSAGLKGKGLGADKCINSAYKYCPPPLLKLYPRKLLFVRHFSIMTERFPNDKKDEPQYQYNVVAEADDGSGSSEILGALIAEGINFLFLERARAQLRL